MLFNLRYDSAEWFNELNHLKWLLELGNVMFKEYELTLNFPYYLSKVEHEVRNSMCKYM